MDTSAIHDFSWAWANPHALGSFSGTQPAPDGATGSCPLCAASAPFGAGSGRNLNEQASGAAGVAGSALPPGLGQGDVITLRHRADAHPQAARPAGEHPPFFGLHAAYNAQARPVQGAEFEEQGHSDRFLQERRTSIPDGNSRKPDAGPTNARQADAQQTNTQQPDARRPDAQPTDAIQADTGQTGHADQTGSMNQGKQPSQADQAGQSRPAHDQSELSVEERQILDQLRQRDAEVRAHEQAHIAAGGQYVSGAAAYSYEQGPDGRQYAVGGEVSIDASPVPGDPEQTEQKAQAVRRAALAPATPSAQDMKVALSASQMEAEARLDQLQAEQEAQPGRGQGLDFGPPSDPAQSRPQTQPELLSPNLSQTQPPSSDPSLFPFTFTPSAPVFTAKPSALIQAYQHQTTSAGALSARM